MCPDENVVTVLEVWKREVERLKEQIAEYEREETSSQTSTESSYGDLEAKIAQKERELEQRRNTTRLSTAGLRKEIDLLKKLLGAEKKVKELEVREVNYRTEIQAKEQAINEKQQQ